jgi:hypothetical protein
MHNGFVLAGLRPVFACATALVFVWRTRPVFYCLTFLFASGIHLILFVRKHQVLNVKLSCLLSEIYMI